MEFAWILQVLFFLMKSWELDFWEVCFLFLRSDRPLDHPVGAANGSCVQLSKTTSTTHLRFTLWTVERCYQNTWQMSTSVFIGGGVVKHIFSRRYVFWYLPVFHCLLHLRPGFTCSRCSVNMCWMATVMLWVKHIPEMFYQRCVLWCCWSPTSILLCHQCLHSTAGFAICHDCNLLPPPDFTAFAAPVLLGDPNRSTTHEHIPY